MLVLVGTHFVPSGTYFCIFIEHKIEWIFKINELKIENWKKLNFAENLTFSLSYNVIFLTCVPMNFLFQALLSHTFDSYHISFERMIGIKQSKRTNVYRSSHLAQAFILSLLCYYFYDLYEYINKIWQICYRLHSCMHFVTL